MFTKQGVFSLMINSLRKCKLNGHFGYRFSVNEIGLLRTDVRLGFDSPYKN